MKKKKLFQFIYLIVLSFLTFSANAQYDSEKYDIKNEPFIDRIILGGGLGLQFGDYTFIDISPIIGYKLTNRIIPGIGITYKYYKDRIFNYETDIYGGSVFLRYYFIPQLFAHGEYELLSYKYFLGIDRVWIESILIGGGYRQKIGERAFLNFILLYNLNENQYQLYKNPIIRLSFDVGL